MIKERKDKLDKIFLNMKVNMSKVDLLSMYSHETYSDFPKNLLIKSLNEFKKDMKTLNVARRELNENEFNLLTEKQYTKLGISKKFYKFFHNISVILSDDNTIESIDFEQELFRQELISLYSHFEGYFQDLQRLLFENDKTLLSNIDKKIPLNKILDAGNYEQLLSLIIDEKLAKSGYEKISSIIKKWKRQPFKIILKLKETKLQELDKYVCIRNIIIHNNSKVDDSLINFLNKNKYKIGQNFELDSDIMKEFRKLIFDIVFAAYLAICSKYPTIEEI